MGEPLYKEVKLAQEIDRMEKLRQEGTIEADKAGQYVVELKQAAMDMLEISPPSAAEVAAVIEKERELNQKEVDDALRGYSADGKKVKYRIVGQLASEEDTDDNEQLEVDAKNTD